MLDDGLMVALLDDFRVERLCLNALRLLVTEQHAHAMAATQMRRARLGSDPLVSLRTVHGYASFLTLGYGTGSSPFAGMISVG